MCVLLDAILFFYLMLFFFFFTGASTQCGFRSEDNSLFISSILDPSSASGPIPTPDTSSVDLAGIPIDASHLYELRYHMPDGPDVDISHNVDEFDSPEQPADDGDVKQSISAAVEHEESDEEFIPFLPAVDTLSDQGSISDHDDGGRVYSDTEFQDNDIPEESGAGGGGMALDVFDVESDEIVVAMENPHDLIMLNNSGLDGDEIRLDADDILIGIAPVVEEQEHEPSRSRSDPLISPDSMETLPSWIQVWSQSVLSKLTQQNWALSTIGALMKWLYTFATDFIGSGIARTATVLKRMIYLLQSILPVKSAHLVHLYNLPKFCRIALLLWYSSFNVTARASNKMLSLLRFIFGVFFQRNPKTAGSWISSTVDALIQNNKYLKETIRIEPMVVCRKCCHVYDSAAACCFIERFPNVPAKLVSKICKVREFAKSDICGKPLMDSARRKHRTELSVPDGQKFVYLGIYC